MYYRLVRSYIIFFQLHKYFYLSNNRNVSCIEGGLRTFTVKAMVVEHYTSILSIGSGFLLSRQNLEIVRELRDRAAQGRACGNLGNTHYLLGNFSQAITFHKEVGTQLCFI